MHRRPLASLLYQMPHNLARPLLGSVVLCATAALIASPALAQKGGSRQKVQPPTRYGWRAVITEAQPANPENPSVLGATEGLSDVAHLITEIIEDYTGVPSQFTYFDYADEYISYFAYVGGNGSNRRWKHREEGQSQYNWGWFAPLRYVTAIDSGLPREPLDQNNPDYDEEAFPRPKLFLLARIRPTISFESATGISGLFGSLSINTGAPFNWTYNRTNQPPPLGPTEAEYPPMRVVEATPGFVEYGSPPANPTGIPGAFFDISPTAELTINGLENGDQGFGFFYLERFASPIMLRAQAPPDTGGGIVTTLDLFGRPHQGDGKNQFTYSGDAVPVLKLPVCAFVDNALREELGFLRGRVR